MSSLNTDEEEEALQDRIGDFGDAVGLAADIEQELRGLDDGYDLVKQAEELSGDLDNIETCEKAEDVELSFTNAKKNATALLGSLQKARVEARKNKDTDSSEKLGEALSTLKSLIRELNQL